MRTVITTLLFAQCLAMSDTRREKLKVTWRIRGTSTTWFWFEIYQKKLRFQKLSRELGLCGVKMCNKCYKLTEMEDSNPARFRKMFKNQPRSALVRRAFKIRIACTHGCSFSTDLRSKVWVVVIQWLSIHYPEIWTHLWFDILFRAFVLFWFGCRAVSG